MLEEELRSLRLAELRLPSDTGGRSSQQGAYQELPAGPASEYRAADSSNSLWVVVDPEGKVLGFEVRGSWLSRLPAGVFANTLLMTYMNALQIASTVESRARANERKQAQPVGFESWSSTEVDLDVWLAKTQARQANIGRQLREAREYSESRSRDVTEIRSPYGFVVLQMRAGGLVGLTADADAISRANPGHLQQDLWEAFSDAGLTSRRGSPGLDPVRSPRRRSPDDDMDSEEDLWKGLGSQ